VNEVARNGYQATTIAQIAAGAKVSRTTLYEYFTDKQDCFLAAFRELAERLTTAVDEALEQNTSTSGAQVVLGALVEFAARQPTAAVVLFHEPAAVGLGAIAERDMLLSNLEQALERAWQAGSPQRPVPDLPARALVGAAVRELAIRLHRRERPEGLVSELVGWSESYAQASPLRSPPAAAAAAGKPVARVPGDNAADRRAARRGRTRMSPRERIVRAVAQLAQRRGYPQVTVTDITAAAGVNRETFYTHFADKESAYVASLYLVFEGALAATARGFFERSAWSERVWNGLRGLTEFLDDERALAHIALSEPYAVGADTSELIIDKQLAFTVFLEEGYRCRPGAEDTSRLTSSLVVCAVFELLDRQLREQPGDSLTALLPQAVYVVLTPFLGAAAARAIVQRKVAERKTVGRG
jgi:AcrR family transcriptional regulator